MKSDTAKLKAALDNLPDTNTMIPIKMGIEGKAFFPGGRGLWRDGDSCISDKKYMLLGQDFDTISAYEKAVKLKSEPIDTNKTWKNLLLFLENVGIDYNDCFFTNIIMGARFEGKNTGRSPAFNDKNYIAACHQIFLKQLKMQKPDLILVLGKEPAKFLGALSDDLPAWQKDFTFSRLDKAGQSIVKKATFRNGVTTSLVMLVHPAMNNSNLRYREYKGKIKNEAQALMVEDVLNPSQKL